MISAHSKIRNQEVAFVICMGLVAMLSRGNPMMEYSEVLWSFLALLSFNLIHQLLLKRCQNYWLLPLILMTANGLLISLILSFSGGEYSNFWVLYLLPIFTACIHLKRRHVFFAWSLSTAFLSYFYLETLWYGADWEKWELLIKVVVLGFSAGITAHVSLKERAGRQAFHQTQSQLDQVVQLMNSLKLKVSQTEQSTLLGEYAGDMLHSLNSPLTVILGSAAILLQDMPAESSKRQEVEDIQASAFHLSQMTASLWSWLHPTQTLSEGKMDLVELLTRILVLTDYRMKSKKLSLSKDLPEGLPRLRLSPAFGQQVLFVLLLKAIARADAGGRVELEAFRESARVGLRLFYQTRESRDLWEDDLESCKDLLAQQGGVFNVRTITDGVEMLIYLPSE